MIGKRMILKIRTGFKQHLLPILDQGAFIFEQDGDAAS